MRDQSKRIAPLLPADFGARITAARNSQASYDKHVAPVVAWALAETGNRREARQLILSLQYDDETSDVALDIFRRAFVALT